MSDFKAYGFCEAGCKRRVPLYEDFLQGAGVVRINSVGTEVSVPGKLTYKIEANRKIHVLCEYEDRASGSGLELRIAPFNFVSGFGNYSLIDLPQTGGRVNKTSLYTIEFLKCVQSSSNAIPRVEVNGSIVSGTQPSGFALPYTEEYPEDLYYHFSAPATTKVTFYEDKVNAIVEAKSAFIRFSANSDGTDFTEKWEEGQQYIGFATALEAPTDKTDYEWVKIGEGTSGDYLEKHRSTSGLIKIYGVLKEAQNMYNCKTSYSENDNYTVIPLRNSVNDAKHPGTFEIASPVLEEGESGFSKYHPITVETFLAFKDEVMPFDIKTFEIESVVVNKGTDNEETIYNTTTFEKGTPVSKVTLKWKMNKTPKVFTINDIDRLSYYVNGGMTFSNTYTESRTFTAYAKDSKGAEDTAYAYLNIYNGVYYGVSSSTDITNDLIRGFAKILQNSRSKTFTVTANTGEYIYYCLPKSYGECAFKVGGFDGGFSLVKTFSFTNESGYTEDYYIYRSDNIGLGNTTVTVS